MFKILFAPLGKLLRSPGKFRFRRKRPLKRFGECFPPAPNRLS